MITTDDIEELLNLLADRFRDFCAENHLPPTEIEELLFRKDLAEHQRRFLHAMLHRWETVEDLYDVLHFLTDTTPNSSGSNRS